MVQLKKETRDRSSFLGLSRALRSSNGIKPLAGAHTALVRMFSREEGCEAGTTENSMSCLFPCFGRLPPARGEACPTEEPKKHPSVNPATVPLSTTPSPPSAPQPPLPTPHQPQSTNLPLSAPASANEISSLRATTNSLQVTMVDNVDIHFVYIIFMCLCVPSSPK